MLSSFETGIITLINNALKGESKPLPTDFDYSQVYSFGVKHQILPMLYYGGAHDPKFIASDTENKMLFGTMQLTALSENQLYEIDRVCKEFDKNGIEYLKLKGSIIKRLYPQGEMRVMSDADILIREHQMKELEELLPRLGYKFKVSSDHEWIWSGEILPLELHKRIIATYQKDFYAFFGDGWNLAHKKNDNSCEYVMGLEDELVYLFTHLSKHYRDTGIGIKHMTDIYLFLNSYPELDFDYINSSLEKLHLLEFFKNVKRTLDVWFEGAECDDVSEFITAKIFESGVYGTRLAGLKSEALKLSKGRDVEKAKKKKYIELAFPKYENMCYIYPWLKKCPVMLPFMWIWRLTVALLFKGKKIKEKSNEINAVNQETVDACQAELNYVGLDFNFEV
ncbi:MAG: nucleotidyltransferase family protein [Clostridia bacterium]|nr:nucleotidyltransferase family protein [Clostridia bacterium]